VELARGPSPFFRLNFAVKSSRVSILDFELKIASILLVYEINNSYLSGFGSARFLDEELLLPELII
jgi:hypothetical protein